MTRLLEQSEATAQALRDGWVHTATSATSTTRSYLFLVDRKKDMIISGGENIYSREVEQAHARAHRPSHDVAVIGVPDAYWGEAGARRSSCARPARTLDEDDADRARRAGGSPRTSARSRWPSSTRCRCAATGKVSKRELRDRLCASALPA